MTYLNSIIVVMYPHIYRLLIEQAPYSLAVILGSLHKQLTYFSKKYSKINRRMLFAIRNKNIVKNITFACRYNHIKLFKHINKKVNLLLSRRVYMKCIQCSSNSIVSMFVRCDVCNDSEILRLCAMYGNIRALLDIMRSECDVDYIYLLKKSITENQFIVFKILINNYVVKDDQNITMQLLEKIVEKGKVNFFVMLLRISKIPFDYKDILDRATSSGNADLVIYLLKNNKVKDVDDAFLKSVANNYFDIMVCLVEYGANIHNENDAALWLSADNGNYEMVKYLVEHGANVCADNNAALCYGAEEEFKFRDGYSMRYYNKTHNINIVKYLLEHGANPFIVDHIKCTKNIQQLLKEYKDKIIKQSY